MGKRYKSWRAKPPQPFFKGEKRPIHDIKLFWHRRRGQIHLDLRVPKTLRNFCKDMKFQGKWHEKVEQNSQKYIDVCLEFSGEKNDKDL